MSDTYVVAGPPGRSPEVLSSLLAKTTTESALTGIMVFTSDGRIIAGVTHVDEKAGTYRGEMVLIDPQTLATLDILPLPSPPVDFGRSFVLRPCIFTSTTSIA